MSGRPPAGRRLAGAERRKQILDTAARVFARKGFEGATTREIARACGVSESALYKYFPSKTAIFNDVLEQRIGSIDFESFLSGIPRELDLLKTFQMVAKKILDVGFGDPLIQKLLLAATLTGSPEAKRLFFQWRGPFIDFIEKRLKEGIHRGEVREIDPTLTARAFVGMVNDCVLNCNLWDQLDVYDADGVNRERLVKNNVPIFVRGLVAEKGTGHKER